MENKIKNSEQYLNSILGEENSFSIPKNYFNNAEERLLNFLLEDKLPKDKPFSTPISYFNSLEDTLITKIKSEEKTTKIIPLKERFGKLFPIAIAASIILSIGVTYFSTFYNNELSFDHLDKNDIETWILEHPSEMTSQDIATFIPIENINGTDFAYTDINDEDIEDYIIYNDSTILNEIN